MPYDSAVNKTNTLADLIPASRPSTADKNAAYAHETSRGPAESRTPIQALYRNDMRNSRNHTADCDEKEAEEQT